MNIRHTQNVIISGTLRIGKDSVTRVAPVVPIKIVAAPPPK